MLGVLRLPRLGEEAQRHISRHHFADAVVDGHVLGGTPRSRFVVQAFYRCSLAAENVTINYGIGEMVTADMTLRLFPEPGQPQNAEHGKYWIEAAGTIA